VVCLLLASQTSTAKLLVEAQNWLESRDQVKGRSRSIKQLQVLGRTTHREVGTLREHPQQLRGLWQTSDQPGASRWLELQARQTLALVAIADLALASLLKQRIETE